MKIETAVNSETSSVCSLRPSSKKPKTRQIFISLWKLQINYILLFKRTPFLNISETWQGMHARTHTHISFVGSLPLWALDSVLPVESFLVMRESILCRRIKKCFLIHQEFLKSMQIFIPLPYIALISRVEQGSIFVLTAQRACVNSKSAISLQGLGLQFN